MKQCRPWDLLFVQQLNEEIQRAEVYERELEEKIIRVGAFFKNLLVHTVWFCYVSTYLILRYLVVLEYSSVADP
jgi:hypothetical protein